MDFYNLKFRGLLKSDIFNKHNDFKFIITCNAEFIVKAQRNRRFANIINNNKYYKINNIII